MKKIMGKAQIKNVQLKLEKEVIKNGGNGKSESKRSGRVEERTV